MKQVMRTFFRRRIFLCLVFIPVLMFFYVGNGVSQSQWDYGFEQSTTNDNSKSEDPSAAFTGLLDLIKQKANTWDEKLRGYAKTVFWSLAAIQFVWIFFPLIFKQAEVGEVIGELVRFVMIIGFFYALLLFSREWAEIIVESFRKAGAQAAGISKTGILPGDVFDLAVKLAEMIGEALSFLSPVYNAIIGISALIILLCFAFIAIFMGLTIIEAYIVINASVLFMGFGGSQWTREYALTIFRYAVSVGVKLFILTLIVGLMVESAQEWQQAYVHSDASLLTMVGLSLACAYIAKTIPELIAALINGTSVGSGATIGQMATAAAVGIAAAASAGAAAAGAIGSAMGGGGGGTAAASGGSGLAEGISSSLSSGGLSGEGSSGINSNITPRSGENSTSKSEIGTQLAKTAIITAGTLASISVPGMEGAENLGNLIGSSSSTPEEHAEESAEEDDEQSSSAPQNIIRPA